MIAALAGAVVVLIWQVLGWLHALPVVVPAPVTILAALPGAGGALVLNSLPTLGIAAAGFALAFAVSLLLAAVGAVVRRAGPPIQAAGIALDSVPLIALTPVLTELLGVDTRARVMIAALACFLPLLLGLARGMRGVDRDLAEVFHVLAASPATRLRLLALPSALPHLLPALKVAAPAALLGALVAEWAGAERGLGIMMTYAMAAFDVPRLWLSILATCAMSLALYGALSGLERLVLRRWG